MSAATAAAVVGIGVGVNSLTGGGITNALGMGGSTPGGGGAGGTQSYIPTDLSGADQGWQQAFGAGNVYAAGAQNDALPQMQNSYNQQLALNYNPYLEANQAAGQQYGNLAQTGQRQMDQYGQAAQTAQGQQQQLYGVGNQLWQTAQDPQNALYTRTQQQLTDQVRAGQAARGLGNSAVGAGEENQAMSNFNIDWQNQQLQRQLAGAQGMGQMNAAGGQQGQLYMANLAAQLQSGAQGAGYQQQAGQVPMAAQQYVAGQPAAAAQQYQQELAAQQGMWQNQAGMAIPYMNAGQGAQQYNSSANNQQSAAGMQTLMTGLNSANTAINTPGSWMNNMFGGSSGQQQTNYSNPNSNPLAAYTSGWDPNAQQF